MIAFAFSTSSASTPRPADVRPKRYLIHLDADPARPDFTGTVRIEVEAASDVPDVRLHARALEVDRATLEQDGSRRDVAVEVDAQEEQLVLKGPLRRGAAVLEIAYRGKVSPSMQGLYFSKDGPDQCLATQCEATDARAFLPCFDEPAFKAHFEWRVTSPAGTTVLTNGEAREAPVPAGVGKEGRVTWSFLPVGPMSSYLLAMVMGRFEPSRTDTERGVAFRVWALGGKQHLGAEAQALAVRLLGWYED
ncbi:MAG TPA: hypothetical protein VFH47_07130, partial [Candidatus Thermoplasmatota archaeon]|nr:hypothetical protein [Candidatus Thermoplasmatota archaeon]